MNNQQFLPKGTQRPSQGDSDYYKLQPGKNKFRIITSAIVGYETWENKVPTRSKESNGQAHEEKQFWAFGVIDRKDKKIKVMVITQATIKNPIMDIIEDEDFGDPKRYDLTIIRDGEDLETRYTVLPGAVKELTEAEQGLISTTNINLDKLFVGGHPLE